MKGLIFIIAVLAVQAGAVAAEPVRNPFWPVGFAGEKMEISAERRPKKAAAAPKKADLELPAVLNDSTPPPSPDASVTEWAEACRKIKIGVVMRARAGEAEERASVVLNGKVCDDGEEVSAVSGGRLFVWRFEGIGKGGVVRLVRVRTEPYNDPKAKEAAEQNGLLNIIKQKLK